jgi:uncharacterized protein (DUF983 family)
MLAMKADGSAGCAVICVASAFVGLNCRNEFFIKLGLPLWSHLAVTGNFNLNMMLKIEF